MELMVARADVVLQSRLWEAARKEVNAQIVLKMELREGVAARSTKLLQLSAKHLDLIDKLSRLNSLHAPGAIALVDLTSVAGARERPAKRAKKTRTCKEAFSTHFTAAFSALLTERDDPENYFEALTLEDQRILGLAAETKVCGKSWRDYEKINVTAKATLKDCWRELIIAAYKRVAALEAEFAQAKVTHAELVDISAWPGTYASKAQADFEGTKVRLDEDEQAPKMPSANSSDAWKQPVESAKAAEERLLQLTKTSSQAQLLEGEVSFLRAQIRMCIKTCDDAIRLAAEQSHRSRKLKARISILKDELDSLKQK